MKKISVDKVPMKILFVVNNAAFFCSHRLSLALAARDAGHQVTLATGQAGSVTLESAAIDKLASHDIEHIVTNFRSGSLELAAEARGFLQLIGAMRRLRPDVVHCASPKGILYGGLAARLTRCGGLVISVSGMGSLFIGKGGGLRSLIRRLYSGLVRFVYAHPNRRVIVQNQDDCELILRAGLANADDLVLIPGSGVDLSRYIDLPLDGRDRLVVLPARLLRDKGVVEFVESARALRMAGCNWRFALVGTADYDNPSAINESQIQQWVEEGSVEWWGHKDDISEVFAQAQVACLPSYREGMPKALLEAAAAGCAVVTTDAIGCREAIVPGKTGDLVPVADAAMLSLTLGRLLDDRDRVRAYGMAGRELAIARFGIDAVTTTVLGLYDALQARLYESKSH
jgi:glycosyltransferase involved in cell wall biosynthesis